MKKQRLKLGLEVGYFKNFYLRGQENSYFECGIVEIIRKDTVLLRVNRGYTREVLKKDLFIRNPNKPRRYRKGWLKLDV